MQITKKQLKEIVSGMVSNASYKVDDVEVSPEMKAFIDRGIPSQSLTNSVLEIVETLEENGLTLVNDKNTSVNMIIKAIRDIVLNKV